MAAVTTLPASFSAGAVLTASQMNNLRGAFRVLQVVEGSTSTTAISSVTTYADTNLTATITPSSTSSKVLVLVSHVGSGKSTGNTASGLNVKLLRGSTDLTTISDNFLTNTSLDLYGFNVQFQYLDSPSSTSALTYKTQLANRVAAAQVFVQNGSRSSIILMEISA
jgi:hypothetical protein